MAWTQCRSGKHYFWDDQTEALNKCCNGYLLMFVPAAVYAQNGGYDPWGNWHGDPVFVKDTDTAEIDRIKALGPMEQRASSVSPWPTLMV